jgi:replication factor A1
VVQKSDIRHYSNQRGEGRFFSVTLMDDSGEIKGTAWNAVVDDLFEKLQENRVYFFSKARVNLAKKKFSTVSNDYELSLDRGTEIEEVRSPLHLLG